MKMNALLLAAGYGTRLRPLTNTIPKCLVRVNDTPLLEYWLKMLFNQGVNRILINTHYLSHQVEEYIQRSQWRNKVVISYENSLLGTGGTVLKNKHFFDNKPFLVAHADNLTCFSLNDFINSNTNYHPINMMTFETDNPSNCGIVNTNNLGVVTNFYEKIANPPGNIANGAVYIFDQEILHFMEKIKSVNFELTSEIIPNYIGKISTFLNTYYFRDIGTPESLKIAKKEMEFPSINKMFLEFGALG